MSGSPPKEKKTTSIKESALTSKRTEPQTIPVQLPPLDLTSITARLNALEAQLSTITAERDKARNDLAQQQVISENLQQQVLDQELLLGRTTDTKTEQKTSSRVTFSTPSGVTPIRKQEINTTMEISHADLTLLSQMIDRHKQGPEFTLPPQIEEVRRNLPNDSPDENTVKILKKNKPSLRKSEIRTPQVEKFCYELERWMHMCMRNAIYTDKIMVAITFLETGTSDFIQLHKPPNSPWRSWDHFLSLLWESNRDKQQESRARNWLNTAVQRPNQDVQQYASYVKEQGYLAGETPEGTTYVFRAGLREEIRKHIMSIPRDAGWQTVSTLR